MKIFQFDKLIHISIFFVFGLFVYRALGLGKREPMFLWYRGLLTILIVMAYGILDEYHQRFVPGRSPDLWDATADTFGGILSVTFLFLAGWKKESPGAKSGPP